MSDSKRATLITVGAPKSAKKNVTKTVRLVINLDESNESKYPELNYKELVKATERKQLRTENGKKTSGLDPFSDNDDDVERVARKFQQKYGSNSTYGKGRSKRDDFADIGAGYDENDSFIDNTDGYDEMIPPECDTLYGGFYINSGSLEFKQVPESQATGSDGEPSNNRRNKRRISSSSSEEDSSDSSSESESQDEKDPKPNMVNGTVDSHKTEHRKKKNKKSEKKSAKRIRRTDSSAATSGKQTSDDNTSQSDSLASKPAPSSETAVTSDSSRDAPDAKLESKLPQSVTQVLEELSATVARIKQLTPGVSSKDFEAATDTYIIRLERALVSARAETAVRRGAWGRAAAVLRSSRGKLLVRATSLLRPGATPAVTTAPTTTTTATTATAAVAATNYTTQAMTTSALTTTSVTTNLTQHVPHQIPQVQPENRLVRKEIASENSNINNMTADEKEAEITETLRRLKVLIDEMEPAMMRNYQAECERVQEEKKKLVLSQAPRAERRLPKRRWPWCAAARGLLARLAALAGGGAAAAALLAARALPLFPPGFVRIPTLLRQADLSRELSAHVKPSELKRKNISQPATAVAPPVTVPQHPFNEHIHFPSSLTVTATIKPSDKPHEVATETNEEEVKKAKMQKPSKGTHHTNPSASKQESQFPTVVNPFSINKDVESKNEKDEKSRNCKESVIVEKVVEKCKSEPEKFMPPNNIGSITITPVLNNQKNDIRQPSKPASNIVTITSENKQKESTIRVKSQATLMKEADELAKRDKDRHKSKHNSDKTHHKHQEKRVVSPLHIDTSYPKDTKKPDTQKVSPSKSGSTKDEVSQKQLESMRVAENNLPRPALVPVHHSPTFAKPEKRAPDPKKPKKDILIVSDVDPLAENAVEPLAIDDSSSDVELVEDMVKSEERQNIEVHRNNDVKANSDVRKHGDSRINESTVPSNRDRSHSTNHKRHDSHNSHHRHSSKDRVKSQDKVHTSKELKSHESQKRVNNILEKMDVDDTASDIHKVMQNLREMQDSQEHNFNNSYGGVIKNAKHLKASSNNIHIFRETQDEKDKLTNFFEQNGWM